ncbi:MAG: hypothetical protein AAGA25_06010 [Planctomycetota bacterium]
MANELDSIGLTCPSCGYDLTGVVVGRSCPECGSDIPWRVTDTDETTRRQAVVVLLRLGAMAMVILSLTLLDWVIWSVVAIVFDVNSYSASQWLVVIGQSIPLVIRIGAAIGLWMIASWLAKTLVSRDDILIQGPGYTPMQLLSVGLILLGAYAFIRGAANLIDWFLSTLPVLDEINAASYGIQHGSSVYTSIAWAVMGLLLMAWPRLRARLGRDLVLD